MITECVGLHLHLPVMSLALATTALRTQLHILVAIPLRRLGTMIDMIGDPLLTTTDMVLILPLPPLYGRGRHLEGVLLRAGKNLKGRLPETTPPQLNTAARSPHHQLAILTTPPALAPKDARDAVPKARLLGLVLVPTRLILLLQAMLDLLRLLLRVLLAIIPPEAGLIKMRVIGGSEYLKKQFCPKLGVVFVVANAKPTSWQATLVLS